MGKISFATGAGVRTGSFTSRSGSQDSVCPLGKKGLKPSADKCKCCSGDTEYSGLSLNFGNLYLTPPASIRLL